MGGLRSRKSERRIAVRLSMMVVITSCAPVAALSQPAMAAQPAPTSAPAASASGIWMSGGRPAKENPTTTAARPARSSWPSAPMLNRPARKASATPRPARISGAAAVSVSDSAYSDPNEPVNMATYAAPIAGSLTPVRNMITPPMARAMITATAGTTTSSPKSKRRATLRRSISSATVSLRM